ncbi:multisubunit potassium/proton antiporter, PhaG subunit [Devosia sp. YR412]|uniref:monovalent cation/H(+) antiporter subunit G n=1 Tax=Devosia sp. YR412 TaxID=1881030 RepID=UPI0008B27918|nr:monovalent cation/H(+) antiporter subunit G [Devosia sp. YR412]SEQ14326.1 multisubunit potassium/proton antiporter, PhaG subunit [Devosia sp. YR412]
MSELPVWAALLVGFFALAGSLLTLLGCLGLARLDSFYERVHAPTLGTSFGAIGILLASILYFSVTGQRPAVHEVLIVIFVSLTTPVTLMLLARAALYRDRAEQNGNVPAAAFGQDVVVEAPADPQA